MKTKGMKIIASVIVFVLMFTYISIMQKAVAVVTNEVNLNEIANEVNANNAVSDGNEITNTDTSSSSAISNFFEALTGSQNGTRTGNENVDFDVYFEKTGNHMYGSEKMIGESNYFYVKVRVGEGYLRSSSITFDNPNFKIIGAESSNYVLETYSNRVVFNQIPTGTELEVKVFIDSPVGEKVAADSMYKRNNVASFNCAYVDKNGQQRSLTGNSTLALMWNVPETELTSEFNISLDNTLSYTEGGSKYVVLQFLVQSKLKNNILPLSNEKIEISLPVINSIDPLYASVIARTTKQINGEDGEGFTASNYTFDQSTHKVTIDVNNTPDSNGMISWVKDAGDEYLVTVVYDGTNLNSSSPLTFYCQASLTLTLANEAHVRGSKEITTSTGNVTPKNIVNYDIKSNTAKISKGQIYANYGSTNKLETEYEEAITANVTYAEMVDKITINQSIDNFVEGGVTSYQGTNYAYFKKLSISKSIFDRILGENGTVTLYNGTLQVGQITKNTAVNSLNEYEVDLSSYNINELRIETTNPLVEGKLLFNIKKAIKGDVGYNINQMKEFTGLEVNIACNTDYNYVSDGNAEIKTCTIPFVEPETKAELVIDRTELSTVTENKNVKLTAILRTDSIDYSLYKNPIININLPSCIENVTLKNVDVRFDTEGTRLNVVSNNVVANTDGTKSIIIELEGTQTEYSLGAISKGINVILTTDIIVNKFTANKQENFTMTCTNNYIGEETATSIIPINIVAPVGVVTISSISGYAEGAEEATAISEEASAVIVDTNAAQRIATMNMNVINNYNNSISNVAILGRTLFVGNKEIVTGTDLTSNIDMPLASGISVSGIDANKIKVYYSENGEATKDLSNTANGWTLSPANIETVKSYLIVVENYNMAVGDAINFNYNFTIPANMTYNKTAIQEYVVFFDNNTVADREVSTLFGVTTGTGVVLETSLTSNVDESMPLIAGQNVIYTLRVKNTGTKVATNVMASVQCPTGITLAEGSSEIALGDIAIGAEIVKELKMEVEDVLEDTIVETNVKLTSETLKVPVETNIVRNSVLKRYYLTTVKTKPSLSEPLEEGANLTYTLSVLSREYQKTLNDTVVTIVIPKELEFKGIKVEDKQIPNLTDITNSISYNFNNNTNTITVNLGGVNDFITKQITLDLVVKELENNTYTKDISITGKVVGQGTREQNIKQVDLKVSKPGIKVSQSCSITENSEIEAYEDFKYILEVENISNMLLENLIIKDFSSKDVNVNNINLTYDNGKTKTASNVDEDGNVSLKFDLLPNQTARVEVNVTAKLLDSDTRISNSAAVYYKDAEIARTGTISHTIKKYVSKSPSQDPEHPTEDNYTKRISGQVWYDTSKNGVKEDDEKKVKDVEVMLYNNATGSVVSNVNGSEYSVKTGEDGTYTFKGINPGKYTVVFLYDSANYSATTYRANGVDETKNSDAIDSKVKLDGKDRVAAITEEIVVTNNNIYNIDLGLVENAKFDLSLNKVVSKITVQDSEKTETTDYNGTKLAKKDLVGKMINSTTILVEYKLQVKNEGAIAGYVKKIVDYMPKEMKFNAELNTDWYQGSNGELYNASLANTLLKPGETKELTLILTKKMSEDSLGLINNTAEIFESYNDLGLEDIDSKVGNKSTNEDDISSADILITVKTGEYVLFIGLAVGIIAIIGTSAIIIKKKVLR